MNRHRTVVALALCCLCLMSAQASTPCTQDSSPQPPATTAQAQPNAEKPFTKDELLRALKARRPGNSKLARQVAGRGVVFRLTVESEAELKQARANSTLLRAVRQNYQGPFDANEFRELLLTASLKAPGMTPQQLVEVVERRGVEFQMGMYSEAPLRDMGATPELLAAVRNNYRPAPSLPVVPTIQADPLLFPPDTHPIPYGDPKSSVTPREENTGPGMGTGRSTGGGIGPGEGGIGLGRGVNMEGGGGPGGKGGPVDYTRPFTHREVTSRAVILSKPEPTYTEEARKNQVSGVVRLRAVLHSSGQVQNISVIKGLPDGLTETAIAAARLIKFKPAQKDGRAVSQYIVLEYNFLPY